MLFLNRVREKLKNSNRQRFVDHFQGSDTQKVFAGLEVLAEDMDKLSEMIENVWQMQQALAGRLDALDPASIPFSDPPLAEVLEGLHKAVNSDQPDKELAERAIDAAETVRLPAPRLVDKPCSICREMMIQVHPSRKSHEACKEARK